MQSISVIMPSFITLCYLFSFYFSPLISYWTLFSPLHHVALHFWMTPERKIINRCIFLMLLVKKIYRASHKYNAFHQPLTFKRIRVTTNPILWGWGTKPQIKSKSNFRLTQQPWAKERLIWRPWVLKGGEGGGGSLGHPVHEK